MAPSGGTYCCPNAFIWFAYSWYSSVFLATTCCFNRPPEGGGGGGSSEVFCGFKSGPRRTWKCSCFFSSPFKLIVTCSFQVYDARDCLFFAIDCLTSETCCCSSGFCALAEAIDPTPARRPSRERSAMFGLRRAVFLIRGSCRWIAIVRHFRYSGRVLQLLFFHPKPVSLEIQRGAND